MFHSTNPTLRRRSHLWLSRQRLLPTAFLLTASLVALPLWADYGTEIPYTGDSDYYQESENSYSFARVLEGSATLLTGDGDRLDVEINQPVLVGDQLWVPNGSRLEVVLADRSLLRIEGDSDITFESIAYSADTSERHTLLRLRRGNIQLVVPRDVLGDSLARIETPGASVFIHEEGTFRLSVGREGSTEVVVRDGLAEIVAERTSRLVHTGEAAWGSDRGGIQISQARYRDGLERWGDDLSYRAARVDSTYVDDSLRYVSAPLATYGGWVSVGGRHAWRPRNHSSDWRPYNNGYWRHTPIGVTWVSHDPWGYVTHHYGDWDYDDGYGWVWYPGRRYAPARVTWYWGPSYVGWCPTGYYSNYYRRHRSGFSLSVGIYGWAGGAWSPFGRWSFTANSHFGNRHQQRYVHSGDYLSRHGHRLDVGVVTSHPGRHARRGRPANEIYASLRQEAGNYRQARGRDLPDVNDFVGRRELREPVATRVFRPADANKPLPIDNAPRASNRGGNTTVVTRDGSGRERRSNTADKPGRLATESGQRPSADRAASQRADKPTVSTSSEDRRRAASRTSADGERERRSYTPITPRTAPDRPTRVIRSGDGASSDKPASTDAGSRGASSSRPSVDDRRRGSEWAEAERRRELESRGNDRQRPTSSVRTTPSRTRPTTVAPSERPRSSDIRREDIRRETASRTSRPATVTPTPRQAPAPRASSSSRTTPRAEKPRYERPTTTRPAPAPRATTRPAPAPRVNTPRYERPTTTRQAPAPRATTRPAPAPRPTTRQAPSNTRRETTRSAPAPQPTTRSAPAPRPTTRSAPSNSGNRNSGNQVRRQSERRPQASGNNNRGRDDGGNASRGSASKRRRDNN